MSSPTQRFILSSSLYRQRLSPRRRLVTLMRPSHPVRRFWPRRNPRCFLPASAFNPFGQAIGNADVLDALDLAAVWNTSLPSPRVSPPWIRALICFMVCRSDDPIHAVGLRWPRRLDGYRCNGLDMLTGTEPYGTIIGISVAAAGCGAEDTAVIGPGRRSTRGPLEFRRALLVRGSGS